MPVEWLFGPGAGYAHGYNGYWIDVPQGTTQLGIHLVTATHGADIDLYANREFRPSGLRRIPGENNEEVVGYESQSWSTGPGGTKSITITPESSPPLGPGLYFIAINVRTAGVRVKGTLTAEVNVSESAISATVPVFSFPASLFTKTVKGENPRRKPLKSVTRVEERWITESSRTNPGSPSRPIKVPRWGKRTLSRLPWTH